MKMSAADSPDRLGPHGFPLLLEAVAAQDVRQVQALLKAGAQLKWAVDPQSGLTALMEAGSQNHQELVRALLNAGSDPQEVDRDGADALMHAAGSAGPEVLRDLLDAGATPQGADRHGRTALHRLAARDAWESTELLLSRGADLEATTLDGLMIAARCGARNVLQRFVLHGASIFTLDCSGTSAVQWAREGGFPELAHWLQDLGVHEHSSLSETPNT